jgi:hypothetical protein
MVTICGNPHDSVPNGILYHTSECPRFYEDNVTKILRRTSGRGPRPEYGQGMVRPTATTAGA